MAESYSAYHENLFQWIWEHLEFDCTGLQTDCGKDLIITDTGVLNHGAGPDFLRSRVFIDGMEWYGAIEIHKSAGDWYRHKHHLDINFNSVILHVVYSSEENKQAKTVAGSKIYTLSLKPRLDKSLQRLLEIKQSKQLPCGGHVSFINQGAFEAQIEKVHNDYFEYKVKEILSGYPAEKPVSVAWKQAMLKQLFKTLGIPQNREPMELLCTLLQQRELARFSLREFVKEAEALAFDGKVLKWSHTGMRPASRPAKRVEQAAALFYIIDRTPLGDFFHSPEDVWKRIKSSIPANYLAGKGRQKLLFNTNILPALYLLGDLLHHKELSNSAKQLWLDGHQFVPQEIKKPFQQAGFSLGRNAGKLGLAHQFKRFCSERNCHRCEVFKSAIRS